LINTKTKKAYEVNDSKEAMAKMGENRSWYSIVKDPEGTECFVKVCEYGAEEDLRRRDMLLKTFEEEGICLEKVSRASQRVPRFLDAWNDRQNKRYVLVMEKLSGMTLRKWLECYPLRQVDDVSLYTRAQIILGLAEILSEITAKFPSMVHRDLKPENIFVTWEKGRWVPSITDFGCAQLKFVRNVGTRFYQAPEQALRGAAPILSTKTDIFSLGLIFFEMLTGQVPKLGVDFVPTPGQGEWKKTPSLPEALTEHPTGSICAELLERMTAYSPRSRADLNEIRRKLNFKPKNKSRNKTWNKK
jgi:serine/threonine protein kinase